MTSVFATYRAGVLRIPQPSPEREDVIIRSSQDCPTDYVVARDHAPAQIRYAAHAAALGAAKRWAVRQHIDVWFEDRQGDFILLSRHRVDRLARTHAAI